MLCYQVIEFNWLMSSTKMMNRLRRTRVGFLVKQLTSYFLDELRIIRIVFHELECNTENMTCYVIVEFD